MMIETTTTSRARRSYHDYLRRYGIDAQAEHVMEMRELDLHGIRFFAYHGDEGLRLRAAITRTGWVSAGHHDDDDWYALLRSSTDAAAIAERIAWLETKDSQGPHAASTQPTTVARPRREPVAGIDPEQWAMVSDPLLHSAADDTVLLSAWLLEAGCTLVRWTIAAAPRRPAHIERLPANELLAAQRPDADARARAIAVLSTHAEAGRTWALQTIADAGNNADVPIVAAVLLDEATPCELRLLAAGTLARFGAGAAIEPLGEGLRSDSALEVRVACAQSLARLHHQRAVDALSEAASDESAERVRIEIVHALSTQGIAARDALRGIAEHDSAHSVRALAAGYLEAMK